jgi:hypothetical protein
MIRQFFTCGADSAMSGHGSTRRARSAQRARQDDMQAGQQTILLDHTQATARLEVRSTDEGPLRQQWRIAPGR